MTARELAEKWGVHKNLVLQYLVRGRIPGAVKVPDADKPAIMVWCIPDDAVRPVLRKPGRKPLGERPSASMPPLKGRTHAQYIWAYQNKYTIGEFAQKLGITASDVVRTYDRSFRTFRETGGKMP